MKRRGIPIIGCLPTTIQLDQRVFLPGMLLLWRAFLEIAILFGRSAICVPLGSRSALLAQLTEPRLCILRGRATSEPEHARVAGRGAVTHGTCANSVTSIMLAP